MGRYTGHAAILNGKVLINSGIATVNGNDNRSPIALVGGYIDIGCWIVGGIHAIIAIANKLRELADDIAAFLNLT